MFEELWTNHDQYDAMVTSAWGDILGYKNILIGIWDRLHDVSTHMKRWSYDIFGSIRQQVKNISLDMDEEKVNSLVSVCSLEVQRLRYSFMMHTNQRTNV
jgi:hypothetical protein